MSYKAQVMIKIDVNIERWRDISKRPYKTIKDVQKALNKHLQENKKEINYYISYKKRNFAECLEVCQTRILKKNGNKWVVIENKIT